MAKQQNVLFITIDQLRADCLIGGLAEHADLPNMRAFMTEGVTFARNFSVANPCGPSRASMLTGQYAMNHRSVRNGTPLRHDTQSIASEMRKAGYLPMLFGYTDTSQDPRAFNSNDPALKSYEYPMPGFHEVTEMRLETSFPWRSHLKNAGYEFDNYLDVYKPVAPNGGAPKLNNPAFYAAEHSDTAFLTNSFLDNMSAYSDQNWFAHLTYIRPHPPLVAPAPYNAMYDPAKLPLPTREQSVEHEMAKHPFLGAIDPSLAIAGTVVGFDDVAATYENIQTLRSVYLGLATEVDHHIGRVIQFLKDTDQYDTTLVVITADHGELLGDHFGWGKMSVYDAAFRTPLMIRMPGLTNAGARINAITESVDIAPTILDWIGADIPNSMDGRSLMPILQGAPPDDWRSYSFSELDFGKSSEPNPRQRALGTTASESCFCVLRDDRFNLVEFAADLPPMLFYRQSNWESENVADKPEYVQDMMRLTRQLLRHRMRNADHTLSLFEITNTGPKMAKRYT